MCHSNLSYGMGVWVSRSGSLDLLAGSIGHLVEPLNCRHHTLGHVNLQHLKWFHSEIYNFWDCSGSFSQSNIGSSQFTYYAIHWKSLHSFSSLFYSLCLLFLVFVLSPYLFLSLIFVQVVLPSFIFQVIFIHHHDHKDPILNRCCTVAAIGMDHWVGWGIEHLTVLIRGCEVCVEAGYPNIDLDSSRTTYATFLPPLMKSRQTFNLCQDFDKLRIFTSKLFDLLRSMKTLLTDI